jgi:hypothetical protein
MIIRMIFQHVKYFPKNSFHSFEDYLTDLKVRYA